jgi:hypothetical protein
MHFHFLHHVRAMDLHGLLDSAEIAGDLFVQSPSDDVFEHFALAPCEGGQALSDFDEFGLLSPKNAVFLNRHANGGKQVFIVHGLGKEIDSAVFHRLYAR